MATVIPQVVARTMLLNALTGQVPDLGVYSPRLPQGVTTAPKAAITLMQRGGDLPLYGPIVSPSFQVVAWGENAKSATQLALQALDVLHDCGVQDVGTVDGTVRVLWGFAEGWPQDVVDSETGWDTSVCFVTLGMILKP